MKKLIQRLLFGPMRTEDVKEGNFLYENADHSRAGKTTIPGNMSYEQWQEGGWSKYNHPECKIRKLKIV